MEKDVSRETRQRARYLQLVAEWNPAINLVADARMDMLEQRHWEDSLGFISLLPDGVATTIDFGSGGGFPSVPLAIRRPEISVRALESDQRKIAFLTCVKAELGLENFHPTRTRIEGWKGEKPDAITARACAPLEKLIAYAAPFMHSSLRCYFLKGRQHAEEIVQARHRWDFDLTIHSNGASPDSVILEVRNLAKRAQ